MRWKAWESCISWGSPVNCGCAGVELSQVYPDISASSETHYTVEHNINHSVERLYCKRPIQCLASSEILTPPTPSPPGECVPHRLWCGGRTHSLGLKGGWGKIFWKTPDTALYSTNVSTLWITVLSIKSKPQKNFRKICTVHILIYVF